MRSEIEAGEGPVYVGGLDRSGKTTLSAFLSSHPRINIPNVGSNMWTYFYNGFGDLADDSNLDRCLNAMLTYKHVRFLDPDENRIRCEFAQGDRSYARLFSLFLRHHAQTAHKARWGAQTGLIERYADLLFDAYEGLTIVHMLRDPRDRYAESLRKWPDGKGRAGGATARWLYSTRLAEQHVQRYPGRYLIVRFEDLVVAPEETVRTVCTAIGEDFDPSMMSMSAAPKLAARIGLGEEGPLLDEGHIGLYEDAVPEAELAYMQLHAGKCMRRHGYAPTELELDMRDRARFVGVDWPNQTARLLAWRGVEEAQQRFPRRFRRRPRPRMIVERA